MSSLWGAFWITPDGEFIDTAGATHIYSISGGRSIAPAAGEQISASERASYDASRQLLEDRVSNGWVRIRSAASAKGLQLAVEGNSDAIERNKMLIQSKWGNVPYEITVHLMDAHRYLHLTAPEFYERDFILEMEPESDVREQMRERLLRGYRRPVQAHRRSK